MNQEVLRLLRTSVALWLILGCSIAAVAVAAERVLALWRFGERARTLADAVTRALFRGDLEDARAQCERSGSPAGDVFLAGLVRTPAPVQPGLPPRPLAFEKVAAAVERQRQQLNLRLRARLWILGTIGATAPFIGLFGTVVGIMLAFQSMAKEGQGGFTVVAAGISEALITTAAGIAVAIEAVVLFNALNTHVQRLALQFKLLAEEYLEILKESPVAALPPRAAREESA
ncbi:MAG TPA: MotA/TolQ/ExbB proton channel family protein [Anaeromyxobacteraceae bacterium]|nr:MotA/TolQ/ExbB proton channel family protein [Anaeromyxobacteraceae bacterium]